MIATILIFSLKSVLCSGLFVAYYLLALKNAKMHSFNRVYLLTAAFVSLVLPFAHFELFHINPVVVPDFPLLSISGKGASETIATIASVSTFSWQSGLVAIYFAVTAFITLKLVVKFIQVYRVQRKGQKTSRDGFQLIKTDDPRAPFSFMNMLFWPKHMRQDSTEGQNILMHELAHIKQYHTLDKILMQLMLAACWLNPLNWFIKKELWLQHEFLADKYAIKDGNSESFARMLLYSVTNATDLSIISPFFQSPVKRRLFMLTQQARNSYGFLRRFLAIPVLLTATLLLSADTRKPAAVVRSPKKIVVVLDAAHGGKDRGGTSIYGYQEKDLTLAICEKLNALSGEYNIEPVTTRNEDVYYSLDERLRKSNDANDAIFLSIHIGKRIAPDRRKSYELGVNPNSDNYSKSLLLASSIASKLKLQQLPTEVIDRSTATVLRSNNHPALLIECGNLDDADNIALLRDATRTEILCRNILSGIVAYNARLTREQ